MLTSTPPSNERRDMDTSDVEPDSPSVARTKRAKYERTRGVRTSGWVRGKTHVTVSAANGSGTQA